MDGQVHATTRTTRAIVMNFTVGITFRAVRLMIETHTANQKSSEFTGPLLGLIMGRFPTK